MSRDLGTRDSVLMALHRAAEDQSASAAFVLGRIYDEAWGVDEDQAVAFKWYKMAADGGVNESLYFVASAYLFGHGVVADAKSAFEYFERASRASDLTAQYMRALCIIDGTGTVRDPERGMRLMRAAASHGSHEAMDYLAAYHLQRGSLRRATEWARRAEESGSTIAPLRLHDIEARQVK